MLLDSIEDWDQAGPASVADVERCHAPEYVAHIRSVHAPTWLDGDTIASGTTFEAALLAAGVAVSAAEQGGLALIRPPGHHALPNAAMGFCIFNNVAIAARYLQAENGTGRIAIIDWDVHHGNGTQAIFWDDPTVFYASIHQWPFYPGSGGPDEQNETTLNVPLGAGSGDDEFLHALDRLVEPALARFDPELLLVSAGFDAHEDDPLASLDVTTDGFREIAARSREYAPRVAVVLEGGYNLATLPDLVASALAGFGE